MVTDSDSLLSLTSNCRMSTGADIPPELFEKLLDYITSKRWAGGLEADRRELSSCALVCRFWSRRCQAKIFEDITLRSREDVEQLISFLENPLSHIWEYIDGLDLRQTGTTLPWIHLIPLQLLGLTKSTTCFSTLNIEGHPMGPGSVRPFRSIHSLLPRSHPSFSRSIYHVTLSDIHFRSFLDLARVVGEMHSLTGLRCHKLSWPDPLQIPSSPRTAPLLHDVHMHHCADSWAAVWLLSGPRRASTLAGRVNEPSKFYLGRDEQSLVAVLARSIQPTAALADGTCETRVCLDEAAHVCIRYDHFTTVDDREVYPSPTIYFVMVVTPVTHWHGPAGPQPSAPHVNAVSIDFALEGITMESSIACDWKAFDETALAISSLRIVVLGFHSHEDLSRFGAEVVDVYFERLRTAGKLKFAIWDSKSERWKRASRDSDATEATNLYKQLLFMI